MLAHRLNATLTDDHQLSLQLTLPETFPPGPVEVIVLSPEGDARSAGGPVLRRRLAQLEAEGRVTSAVRPKGDLAPLAARPGALQRFLEDR